MKKLHLLLIFFVIIFASCEKESSEDQDKMVPFTLELQDQAKSIVSTNNEFGFSLYKELYKTGNNKNLMLSPTSVAIALTMAYNGAAGDTKKAFENTLGLQNMSVEDINNIYMKLIEYLENTDEAVKLNIANSIWHANDFPVEQNFLDINSKYFNAEVESADFQDPNTLVRINNWIEKKTNDKIKDMLDNIPSSAVMYLINAIYFKAQWRFKFKKEDTYVDYFNTYDKKISRVNFMNAMINVNHATNEEVSILELPYGNNDYSMVILLPNGSNNVKDIVNSLSSEKWDEWIKSTTTKEVNVHLPKFKFEYKKVINDELTEMGLGKAMESDADFSKITKNKDIYISRVIHQSFIEVDEEGTEAAAATIVEIKENSMPSTPTFKANKPFVFVIKEKKSNSVVFIGQFLNPQN